MGLLFILAVGAMVDFGAWDGQSALPDGWTGGEVRKSSVTGAFAGGLWFNGVGYWLRSPRFGHVVETVEVNLAYSVGDGRVPTRVLTLRPIVDGREADALNFDVPARTKAYETQVRNLAAFETDEFVIRLEGGGRYGNWYVDSVRVCCDETRPVAHADEPPAEAAELATSNCWRVSEFARAGVGRRARDADFSIAGTVAARSRWTNGVSADSLYAFANGQAVTNVYPATYKVSWHGLYAALTNEADRAIHVLALQATRDVAMEMVLPVELDAERDIDRLTVTFRGWEPKVGTAPETRLAFHWCAAKEPGSMRDALWTSAPEGDYSGGGHGAWRTVRIPGADFRGAKFLGLRWRAERQANSSLLGFSDLNVAVDLTPSGLMLQVR